MTENCTLVDPSTIAGFNTGTLNGKSLIVIPSQGEHDTNILVGSESEMQYEQRQEAEAFGQGNIFVARAPLPEAEDAYRQMLFGDKRPIWLVPAVVEQGKPLDQLVLGDEALLAKMASLAVGNTCLYGFNQTAEMQNIADTLGIPYYGNAKFASWAGGKVGLSEFVASCGAQTPHTFALHSAGGLMEAALQLKAAGYEKLVVKVNHSTGGMGHKVSPIDEILSSGLDVATFLPAEFTNEEGAAVQGWIDDAKSMSIASFVEHDGSACFTGAQVHRLEGTNELGAIGAEPIHEADLEVLMKVGSLLLAGYVAHQAYGPHTMGMILPPSKTAEKLGFSPGVPLCNDENSRPGASTISKSWILALREGYYGIGWLVSKIKVPQGTRIADVIEALDANGILLKKTGTDAHGIFVYNGGVLDHGEESAFYAVAISGHDNPDEAKDLMAQASSIFTVAKS